MPADCLATFEGVCLLVQFVYQQEPINCLFYTWRHDTQHNAIQHNDIQHNAVQLNDIRHKFILQNDTQHDSFVMQSVLYGECHK